MCDETYQLYYHMEPPFLGSSTRNGSLFLGGLVYESMINALNYCCETRPTLVPVGMGSQEAVLAAMKNNSIALPISYTQAMLRSKAAIFIRTIDSPGLSIIAPKPNSQGSVLMNQANSVGPMFLFMLLLIGYAAWILWLAELSRRDCNPGIPRRFIPGYLGSFYCAVVTASTVGYGDIVPKSKIGKGFVVAWIFVGLGVQSAFTASMTTLLTSEQAVLSTVPSLESGEKIGVLQGSLARQVVIQSGAIAVEGANFSRLHDMLHEGKIGGILLNRYYCSFVLNHVSEKFLIESYITDAISTGYVYYSRSPAGAALRTCLQEYALIHALEQDLDLQRAITHRAPSRNTAVDIASVSIKRLVSDTLLIWLSCTLLILLVVTLVAEIAYQRWPAKRSQQKSVSLEDKDCSS